MLKRVYSDLDSFKELSFNEGLNILIATKTKQSGDKQTRNRVGKSSLIELIHFLFGSSCKRDNLFRKDEIIENEFGIDFDFMGDTVSIARTGSRPSKIIVYSSNTENWVIQPRRDRISDKFLISNTNWISVLSTSMFGLNTLEDEEVGASFRQLFPYFVRRQGEGAFEDPFKFFSVQAPAVIQSCFFFFLGLDLSLPMKWQKIREREKTIKELKKAVGSGLFKDVIESTSILRTNIALTESKITKVKEQIKDYKILPEYEEIEKETSLYVSKLNEISNDSTIDLQLLDDLKESIEETPLVDTSQIERIYTEAGLMFSDTITKRLNEVIKFHKSIYLNRENYLLSEIRTIESRLKARDKEKDDLQEKYSANMKTLKSHGALEPYVKLQEKLDKLTVDLKNFNDQYDIALSLETNKTLLKSERTELLGELVNEYKEQKSIISDAIVLFESISSELYEEAGSLHIGESLNGPTFEIKIQGEKSKGINNMQIFCLDFTLMILMAEKGLGSGFLVHDSHIFDGVDERQIHKALELGRNLSVKYGFQYIVTMNSDVFTGLTKLSNESFNVDDFKLRTQLTDETDSGGLFGIRF